VTGWLGDFFRMWWALLYWNFRKSWFRLQGAHRDDCPCQNPSDSGLAYDTRCDAVALWNRPRRFRKVCPLLVETKDGWRCSVEAEGVRPFWGRAALIYGLALVALYLAGTGAVFLAMRAAHYEVTYAAVAWPRHWRELRGAQERLYARRAQQALQKGDYQEAILALDMVCQLNPRNYSAGLALASLTQAAANPFIAEHIYERLMVDVPEKRIQTAQIWFRTLLARGDYDKIMPLARTMLSEDPAQRGAWLNALLFAARQAHEPKYLADILVKDPHLPEWCSELIALEKELLEGRMTAALPALTRIHHDPAANYLPYYQVERLLLLGRVDDANTVLNGYGDLMQPDEASFLRLRIYRAKKWDSLAATEMDNVLHFPMAPRVIAQFCAFLIGQPDAADAHRYYARFAAAAPALGPDSVALYQATYLAVAASGDDSAAEEIRRQITQFTASDARVLRGLVELLKAGRPDPRLSRVLPLVPLPTEVMFAIVERLGHGADQP
jgi:tetratricopeptide (TPR) repeat protein